MFDAYQRFLLHNLISEISLRLCNKFLPLILLANELTLSSGDYNLIKLYL